MDNSPLNNELGHSMSKLNRKNGAYFAILILLFLLFYFLFISAPMDFVKGSVVRIESGMNLRNVSSVLKKQHIIRSRVVFEFFVLILGSDSHIISADYFFENKLSVFSVARRIVGGEHRMAPLSVTIPEGYDSNQIADTFASKLLNFNKNKFLTKAKDLEGYLFPDTYFFLTNANEQSVVQVMNDNFKKKTITLSGDIVSSGKKKRDIIIMASILEREAKGDNDREIISGILWKRISINMPLQVDAAMITYKEKGLPDSPIGNPGLLAIKASIHPQNSPYLYYLHDKEGNVHYAKNFTDHIKNKLKYLK